MVSLRVTALAWVALMACASAIAAPANHVVANYGNVTVPFTHSVGNSFSGSVATGFVSQDGATVTTTQIDGVNYFYDDFVFTLPQVPQANFNAAAVTLDLGSFLSLQNFAARLYKLNAGLSSLTTGQPDAGALIKPWTSTALVGPGFNGTAVLFDDVPLEAGASYVLEFRGTIAGAFGGSYGGNLNITPVPEPQSAALVLASLGALGVLVRRRQG